jgi:hypothetical protein
MDRKQVDRLVYARTPEELFEMEVAGRPLGDYTVEELRPVVTEIFDRWPRWARRSGGVALLGNLAAEWPYIGYFQAVRYRLNGGLPSLPTADTLIRDIDVSDLWRWRPKRTNPLDEFPKHDPPKPSAPVARDADAPTDEKHWNSILKEEGHALVKGIGAGGGYADDEHDLKRPLNREGDQKDGMTGEVPDIDVYMVLGRHRDISEYKAVMGKGRKSMDAKVLRSELQELVKTAKIDHGATGTQIARLLGVERKAVERLLS